MEATLNLLNTLLPMLYALAVVNYSIDFFRDDPFAKRMARPMLAGVVAVHALYLALRTVWFEHIPMASVYEVMTTIAFAVTVVYSYVEMRARTHKTGLFLVSFSFALQTISSAFIANTGAFPDILRSPLFGIHTGSAVLGYTAFTVSAIYGVLYLLLYHDLKASHFGIIYQRLPSLDILAKMSLRSTVLGAVFLTVTIAIGTLWASQHFSGFYDDPKFILTVVVWLVYVVGIVLHYAFGWSGRRMIYLSLLGFGMILFSALAARLWLPSFHGFV